MGLFVDLRGQKPVESPSRSSAARLRRMLRAAGEPRSTEALAVVREILDAVRREGDAAVSRFTERFDGVALGPDRFRVSSSEIDVAVERCEPELLSALRLASDRIEAYHRRQHEPVQTEVDDGMVRVVELRRAVDRVGLYAPGGRHDYPSSVLMLAIPARVAGVSEIALCLPPRLDGSVAPASLVAARLAGVEEIYRLGGAQAIGAMAYGTETVSSVDLIAGPGNIYVALAEQEVAGIVGITSLAGPSEVLIVADAGAPAEWIALDLAAQEEHGPLGSCLLVTWELSLAEDVNRLIGDGHEVRTVMVEGPEQALDVINAYAPEHLQLMVAEPESLLPGIRHAGAVFCGYDAPTALGDYIAGPNHVLPTAGTARFAQALRVSAFEKVTHAVFVGAGGLGKLVDPAACIARAEGLTMHEQSLRGRLA
jgi:histidinol dehydrogenase